MRALSTRNDEPEKASRPWDQGRDGFVIGEGSGIMILEYVSQSAIAAGLPQKLDLKKAAVAVRNCRNIGKKDLLHNNATPKIEVDPETYEVRVDGNLITCEPACVLPLAQRYFLF